jgi:hypothetical protein
MRRFRLLVAAATALALMPATGAQAAAPRYIMVTGPGIERPIVLDDWRQNHSIMVAIANAQQLRIDQVALGAPRLRLSFFWYRTPMPRPTWPSQATQYGWLHLANGPRPAVILMKANGVRAFRMAPERVLRILARAGVPLRA